MIGTNSTVAGAERASVIEREGDPVEAEPYTAEDAANEAADFAYDDAADAEREDGR